MNPISVENFGLRLAHTIGWCLVRVKTSDPKNCLRTPELRPGIFEESRFSAIETVEMGRGLYGGVEIYNAQPTKDLGGGRLFVYYPDSNLCCGAAEQETHGFFDVDNVPPWDTWVAYFEDGGSSWSSNYLISWVPPQFVELVSQGIYVNPEECIVWLTDTDIRIGNDEIPT